MAPIPPSTFHGNSSSNQVDSGADSPELVALLELREFIASELDYSPAQDNFQRTFRPLTNGLGLESPIKKEPSPANAPPPLSRTAPRMPPAPAPVPEFSNPPLRVRETKPEFMRDSDIEKPIPRRPIRAPRELPFDQWKEEREDFDADAADEMGPTASRSEREHAMAREEEIEHSTPVPIAQPPRMPTPSVFKRLLAALIDQGFVLAVFLLTLAVTIKALSGDVSPKSLASAHQLPNPALLRFAILEFSTLWLGYFALGIGILDMTIGMWVWGLRVGYRREADEPKVAKKLFRIVLSFFFYAPVLPLFLLLVQRRGRNLLDFLSGTNVYKSAA